MFLAVAAGISAAAGIAGMYETTMAQKAAMERLNIQEKQKELQLTQKKTSVYDQTKKVLQRQVAEATVRGIGMDSPSFNAIQRETLNISSKELQNLNTQEKLSEYSFDAERDNVRRTTHARLFGDVASMATSFAMLKGGALSSPSDSSAPEFK